MPKVKGYPVHRVDFGGNVLAKFPAVAAAARDVRRHTMVIHRALMTGKPVEGAWYRYGDMPPACQPLRLPRARVEKRKRKRGPVYVNAVEFESWRAASKALCVSPNTLWMREARKGRRRYVQSSDVAMATTG